MRNMTDVVYDVNVSHSKLCFIFESALVKKKKEKRKRAQIFFGLLQIKSNKKDQKFLCHL